MKVVNPSKKDGPEKSDTRLYDCVVGAATAAPQRAAANASINVDILPEDVL